MSNSNEEAAQNESLQEPRTIKEKYQYATTRSKDCLGCTQYFIESVIGEIGFTVLMVFYLAVPIAATTIGAIHHTDCRAQKHVSTFLIVSGVTTIIRIVLTIIKRVILLAKQALKSKSYKAYLGVYTFDFFALVWFIVGAIWVYGIYEPNYEDKEASDYCHPTAYLFAFIYITVNIIVIILSFCFTIAVTIMRESSVSYDAPTSS